MKLVHLAIAAVLAAWPAIAQQRIDTQAGRVSVHIVASGLEHPWGLAFLPDGRMLVTERPGRLRIVSSDGSLSAPLGGLPDIWARGQGGLLDLALAPDFATSRLVYLTFAEPGPGGASTAVARGRLEGDALAGTEVIFRQRPKIDHRNHFGGRLAFAPDGTLFVTLGDRFQFDPAQDVGNHIGAIVRINADGGVPSDNPFIGRVGAQPEIWSYGHRNVQGAAIHPGTGQLWINEHGPRGGDEVNVIRRGGNYGWPLVSWGRHYHGPNIPDPPTRPDLVAPIHHWSPSIAPSGMAFYTGDAFPSWRGNVFVGALVAEALIRLTLDGERVTGEERIGLGARIRDIRQGPDGLLYVLTDESDGRVLRLSPAR